MLMYVIVNYLSKYNDIEINLNFVSHKIFSQLEGIEVQVHSWHGSENVFITQNLGLLLRCISLALRLTHSRDIGLKA